MKYCDRCHTTYPTEFSTCPKDQAPLRPVTDLAEGMVLRGKYEILEKVGAGGMATVYRVRHLYLQEDVALKVVSGRLAEDPGFIDRFKTEAVITRKLRHPNAVRLDDFDTTEDGRPFIVMEYVRGQSLRELLRQSGWLAAPRAAHLARQVALALGAAHQLGIVHRDIKPENILLVPQADGGDLVKVLDFGIAKVSKGSFDVGPGYTPTQTGLVLGTPQYLSPEQARGKHEGAEVDGRADLYALGVVLYEMLTGRVPFHADTPFDLLLHHIQTPPTPPHLVNPSLNLAPAMSELVMRALEKDPAKRFQSGEQMAEALTNPEVLVQAEVSAHAFSTAALAAAAANLGSDPGHHTVPAQDPAPAPTPSSVYPATVPVTLPVERTVRLETEAPPASTAHDRAPASSAPPAAPQLRRIRRWALAALATSAAALVAWVLIASNRGESASAAKVVINPPPAVARPYAPAARPTANRRRASASPFPPSRQDDSLQHARAQELVDQGYRRMERRDFAAAREAFEEALEIEPDNAAAQRGLRTAITAQTVQGVAGVFRR